MAERFLLLYNIIQKAFNIINLRGFKVKVIKDMTLEEKIGQLFIIGFNGTEINNDITEFIHMNIGGVILF